MTFYNRYIPVEVRSVKCGAAEVSANEVEFDLPYECQGVIAQVFLANGDNYVTGVKPTIEENSGEYSVKVDATALNTNDIVSVLCFKAAAADKNPTGMYYDRYMPLEVLTRKANSTEAAANNMVFDLPYKCQGVLAQVVQDADDRVDAAGLKAVMSESDGQHKVTVTVSSLAEDDMVSIMCWAEEGIKNGSRMYYNRYVPFEVGYKKATAAEASANEYEFEFPYEVNGAIAQIRSDADGTQNVTELEVEIDSSDAKKVTVSAQSIALNDHISIIAFK